MSDFFPAETMKALEEEYRALRAAGLSHKRAAALIKGAMTKAIPAAVSIVMDDIRRNGLSLEEFKAMTDAGWLDADPREAREIERHQREEEQ